MFFPRIPVHPGAFPMSETAQETTLTPQSLNPPVQRFTLTLTPPSIGDNTADIDRLARGLAARFGIPVPRVSLENINRFSRTLWESEFEVLAQVAFFEEGPEIIHLGPKEEPAQSYGFALDLGSTTMTFYFLDLARGETATVVTAANPQARFGDDILTRLHFAGDVQGLGELRRVTVDAVNRAVETTTGELGWDPSLLMAAAIAGNTTMTHFFLGLDTFHLIREPYIPAANRVGPLRARDLGLMMNPFGLVYVFPNVGSYFGGDLLAGILHSGIYERDELAIMIDVGTNAEVVLGNSEWLLACAGAAGPALEGGVVAVGMTAGPGAVERVRIHRETGEPDIEVMGKEKPVGVCGSGLIDLVAELFLTGVLTVQGKLDRSFPTKRIVETEDGAGYLLVSKEQTGHGKDIVVTNTDINILLKSKAAMYTILNVMVAKVGIGFDDVEKFFVAGTFGNHIDPNMAVSIGMIPDISKEKFVALGNAAGLGACRVLFDRAQMSKVDEIARKITYVELNVDQELMNTFRAATFLPHTDLSLFPSVKFPGLKHKEEE